jgi:hypothetical protein
MTVSQTLTLNSLTHKSATVHKGKVKTPPKARTNSPKWYYLVAGYNLGDPPSLKSGFTTCFPTSKYMYKPVLTLSETFYRPLHEAMFTPTPCCRRALTPCASEQSRLRPWTSAAIWRACGATLGPNHEARCHGRPARGRRSITRPGLRRRRAP